MNASDLIHWDICFALKKLREQVETRQIKELIITSSRKIIDIDEFRNYIETTKIESFYRLNQIQKKAEEIIELQNNVFEELEILNEKNAVHYSFFYPGGGFQINKPFESIVIQKKKFYHELSDNDNSKQYLNSANFERFSSQEFAVRSASIKNIITAFVKSGELNKKNTESNTADKKVETSKLTHLLKLYYEKGCKPLNRQQVEKLAAQKKITTSVLLNRWSDLKSDQYQHNGNVNNVKEFIKSYKLLLEAFEPANTQAHRDVKNHYDQLKESYPDLAY